MVQSPWPFITNQSALFQCSLKFITNHSALFQCSLKLVFDLGSRSWVRIPITAKDRKYLKLKWNEIAVKGRNISLSIWYILALGVIALKDLCRCLGQFKGRFIAEASIRFLKFFWRQKMSRRRRRQNKSRLFNSGIWRKARFCVKLYRRAAVQYHLLKICANSSLFFA